MAYQTLLIEERGPIASVWLNRPQRLNALDTTTLEEIAAAFTELREPRRANAGTPPRSDDERCKPSKIRKR
jgi:enoyl-CoA hydratase/carnithine racemase